MTLSKKSLSSDSKDLESVQPFRYRMAMPHAGVGSSKIPSARVAVHDQSVGHTGAERVREESEKVHLQVEEAFQRGVGEGKAAAKAELASQLEVLRSGIASCLQEFTKEREKYFESVERRVVELALAIARKILHREAQMDPLVLAGVARVALDSISSASIAKLRVHPSQVFSWSDFFSRQQGLSPHPEIVGDTTLGLEQCVLESDLGSVDLGLESQLVEIERGFVDLIALKP